jgi:hypothetical protein
MGIAVAPSFLPHTTSSLSAREGDLNREALSKSRRFRLRGTRIDGRIQASGSSGTDRLAPTDQLWRELIQPGGWQTAVGLPLNVGDAITLFFGAV